MKLMENKKKILHLVKKIQQGQGKIDDYLALASHYFNTGSYDEVIKLYGELDLDKISNMAKSRVYYETGLSYYFMNQFTKAVPIFSESIKFLEDEDKTANSCELMALDHAYLFRMSSKDNAREFHASKAISYFLLLIDKYSGGEQPHLTYSGLAEIFIDLGENRKALEYYEKALERCTNDDDKFWVLEGLGVLYGLIKDYENSIIFFNKALSISLNETPLAKLYYDFGLMYFDADRFYESEIYFKKALKSQKKDPVFNNNIYYKIDLYWHLGFIYYETGKDKQSLKYLKKVLGYIDINHPYYANCHLLLGHNNFINNNFNTAQQHYRNVLNCPIASNEEMLSAENELSKMKVFL